MNILLVAVGAGAGGALRYLLSDVASKYLPIFFPYGTLIVNVLGSILLGVIVFGFAEKGLMPNNIKLLLAVGFCGGFTTFSTFSLETLYLALDTEYLLAAANVAGNVLLTILGVYIGYLITR